MRMARSLVPPIVVIAAVLTTAVVSVTGSRPVAALSTASVMSLHSGAATGAATRAGTGAGTGAGTAAKTPGWRTVATFGAVHGVPVAGSITAGSANVAWSVWTGPGYTEVARFTGKAWVKVPLPAKLVPYAHAAVAFDGNSATDFWLFSDYNKKTAVLRWTGTSWELQALPSWALPKPSSGASAFVIGPGNVWLFNLGAGAFGAHYNGRTWARVRLPDTPVAVTGLAANDIYVLGRSSVLRWTGSKWLTIGGIPPVPIPIAGTFSADAFTASGPNDAWLAASAHDRAGNVLARFLFHWNGKAWSTAPRPADIIGSLAPDGAAGLWASGLDINPGGFWFFYHLAACHLTACHWTEAGPPAPVFNHEQEYLTWIPGSRSLWGVATGYNVKTGASDTLILKYGP
jgi:hypothetical protein